MAQWDDDAGTSLIEIMVAAGVLCGAVVSLAALIASSAGLMTAARHRTCAAILARTKIEELLAAAHGGAHILDGVDSVDAVGTATADNAGIYTRRWRLVGVAAHPDRLSALQVDVTARLPGGLHVVETTLTTIVEQQP
jgi:Tfp pilus assembly protein PilV